MRRVLAIAFSLAALSLAQGACETDPTEPDSGSGASGDLGPGDGADQGGEAPADTGASLDTGRRPDRDTGAEPVEDTGPEPVEDTGPEPVEDTGPEPVEDTGPEPVEDTGPEPVEDTGPEPAEDTGPEPVEDGSTSDVPPTRWIYYCDGDGDGWASRVPTEECLGQGCVPPGCQVEPGADCDDARSGVHPGAPEACNGLDDDCDPDTGEEEACRPACPPGWADCDGAADNGCETDVQSDPGSCGQCGNFCLVPAHGLAGCNRGRCGLGSCLPGWADCDGLLANGCEANLLDSPGSCGGCGRGCGAPPNGTAACSGGQCVVGACEDDFADCDGDAGNGCETYLATAVGSCGRCGLRCPSPPNGVAECFAGECGLGLCLEGWGDCDRDPNNGCETHLLSTIDSCGACGRPCWARPNASTACVDGECMVSDCGDGFADCDGRRDNGCEARLASSPAHCGACGAGCVAAPNAAASCVDAQCRLGACAEGYASCDGDEATGCETHILTAVDDCGACGASCSAPPNGVAVCREGRCGLGSCAQDFADCDGDPANGCEAFLAGSATSCGACGVVCPVPPHGVATCDKGECARGPCVQGWGDCDGEGGNGCEADLLESPLHCGGCEHACPVPPNAEAVCAQGRCGVGACAEGYADCDGDPANGCEVHLRTTVEHCGGCERPCAALPNATPGCSAGACGVGACGEGFADCDGVLANGCETFVAGSPEACGACGVVCAPPPNAAAACVDGECGRGHCQQGWGDCDEDPDNGCETGLPASTLHCGACGQACPVPPHAEALCVDGRCGVGACQQGYSDCDGDPANGCEVHLRTDLEHCGACERPCAALPNATPGCSAGACGVGACVEGFANCDGALANGCETFLQGSPESCGACGVVCAAPPHATAACTEGHCTRGHCLQGWGDCDGSGDNGCETDLLLTPRHCGRCGLECAAPPNAEPRCQEGLCGLGPCLPGYADCDGDPDNGCEEHVLTTPEHCGACERSCPAPPHATPGCADGECAVGGCAQGFDNCDGAVDTGCETALAESIAHCGACERACPVPANAAAGCADGSCGIGSCLQGFDSCDGTAETGCETDLRSSLQSCGACDTPCVAPPHMVPTCVQGECGTDGCEPGWGDCDALAPGCETDLAISVDHCGACGEACAAPAHGVAGCANGECTVVGCEGGFGDCDGDPGTGCETDLATTTEHCGACERSCDALAHAQGVCEASTCRLVACSPGFEDCDGEPDTGCEAELLADPNNCDECGRVCPDIYGACGGGVPVCRSEETVPAGIYYIIYPQCDANGDGTIGAPDFVDGDPPDCDAVNVNYCIEASRICAGGQQEGPYGCVGWLEDCAAAEHEGVCGTGADVLEVPPAHNQRVIIAGASQAGYGRLEDVDNVDYINWWGLNDWVNNVNAQIPAHPGVVGTVGHWMCANSWRLDHVRSRGGPADGVLQPGDEESWGLYGPGYRQAVHNLLDWGYSVLLITTNTTTLREGYPEPIRPTTQANLYAWNDFVRCLAFDLQAAHPGRVALFDLAAVTSTAVNGPLRPEYAAGDQYHLSPAAYQEVIRPELGATLRQLGVTVEYPYIDPWSSGWNNREPRWW